MAQESMAPIIEVEPRHYLLVPIGGRFANTDSLLVQVDSAGRVTRMRFVYDSTMNFQDAVREYIGTLGAPKSRTASDSAAWHITHVRWADSKTAFDFTRAVSDSGRVRVYSELFDLSTTGN